MQVFADAGVSERVRFLYPDVSEDGRSIDTMVHSKVMVVDDALLRVGSANLNNRSFGLDTECDLAFEATSAEHRAARSSASATACRPFLRRDGRARSRPRSAQTGSLIKTVDALGAERPQPQADRARARRARRRSSALEEFADPERPIAPPEFAQVLRRRAAAGAPHRPASPRSIAVGLFVVLLVLAWRLTPLAALTDPAHDPRNGSPTSPTCRAAPAIVLAIFVVGGLLVFPVTLLIAATAATFGPWLGFAYAAAGAARQRDPDLWRRRADRPARRWKTCWGRGSTASAAPSRGAACSRSPPCAWCRSRRSPSSISPPAPAGSRSPTTCSAPSSACCRGSILMSALGHQIFNVLTEPTPLNVVLFVLAVIAWIAASLGDPGAGDAQLRRATRDRAAQQHVRVMTWNIHGGIGTDRQLCARAHHRDDRPARSRHRRVAGGRFAPRRRRRRARRSSCCARRSASTASRPNRSAPPTATTARCWSAAGRSTRPRSTTSPMPTASRAARSRPRCIAAPAICAWSRPISG